ncbi:hypothetical protein LEMLEM_LOCUS21016 [Lemmus lemmus]
MQKRAYLGESGDVPFPCLDRGRGGWGCLSSETIPAGSQSGPICNSESEESGHQEK